MSEKSLYPQTLQELIGLLQRLPGIGSRTAERLALSLMEWSDERLNYLGTHIAELKKRIHVCKTCGNLAEEDLCLICRNPARNQTLVCIVEQASQINVIERSGCFNGLYHVLGGRIVPLEGKGPDDIRIRELKERVDAGQIQELIIATSSDVEGEATAAYIAREFADSNLAISRIAAGVPVGADLSFADIATVSMALTARRSMRT